MEISFIYNEVDKAGNFKAVYYSSIDPAHKSEIKFVTNKKKRIIQISEEQQDHLRTIVNMFIGGHSGYTDNGNEELDHSLLVSSEDGIRPVNYYYWKDNDVVPKGVEQLLKVFENIDNS